jgi:hypothetical protein
MFTSLLVLFLLRRWMLRRRATKGLEGREPESSCATIESASKDSGRHALLDRSEHDRPGLAGAGVL